LSGLIGSTGQTWDASTGQYRLIAPNNGLQINDLGQLGYVGSYVPTSFTDVKVTADFVQNSAGRAYGITARTDGVDGINLLKGYAYAYEPFAAGGLGEMVLYRITGADLHDIGSQQVTLDVANKDYTFSLEIIGNELHGTVFEIGGDMVAEKFAVEEDPYTSGFSGLFGFSGAATGLQTDFTVDNFSSSEAGAIPGDFDDNGVVDGDDLNIWKNEFGQMTNGADANGDGTTDGADFLIWQTQFTGSLPASSPNVAAVPEPLALTMLLPAIFIVVRHGRRIGG
jgi:hypothetical protein